MPNQAKNATFLILFLLSSLTVFSQERVLDSLLEQLNVHTKRDSVRVGLLVNTAWNMTHTDPEGAFVYVDEALVISSDLAWPKGMASALRQKGNLHYVMANNLDAMDAFQEGFKDSTSGRREKYLRRAFMEIWAISMRI